MIQYCPIRLSDMRIAERIVGLETIFLMGPGGFESLLDGSGRFTVTYIREMVAGILDGRLDPILAFPHDDVQKPRRGKPGQPRGDIDFGLHGAESDANDRTARNFHNHITELLVFYVYKRSPRIVRYILKNFSQNFLSCCLTHGVPCANGYAKFA